MTNVERDAQSDDLADYVARLRLRNMAPLWEVLKDLVPMEPRPTAQPGIWPLAELRPYIAEAAQLVSTEIAERRVLVLENSAMPGQSRITPSLYAGVQILLGHETAPTHRHSAAAIRFVLEGEGGYTEVDDERVAMVPGDLVITPSWCFHGHGNTGNSTVLWVDVLDLPIVNLLSVGFAEHSTTVPGMRTPYPVGSFDLLGAAMIPVDLPIPRRSTPIVHYPYRSARRSVEALSRTGTIDPVHGARMKYSDPLSGGWVTPTMGCTLALLPKGFDGSTSRSTDGTICVVAEGAGVTFIGDEPFAWTQGDVFVIPPWARFRHTSPSGAILFATSDRPAQEALGLWREHRE